MRMNNPIAQTIVEQLGGHKFRMMTGANSFLADGEVLSFRIPGGGGFAKDGINYIEVTLTPADVYTMAFFRRRGHSLVEVARVYDVYCDQLRSVFTKHTGLETSLGSMGRATA
jgi:hypothetical protein